MANHRLEGLRKFQVDANKRHGAGSVGIGASLKAVDIPRIQTGSLMLDFAMGGGVPHGRTIRFLGDWSSGKTTTAYRIAGIAQSLCVNCLRPAKGLEVKEAILEGGIVEHYADAECDCFTKGLMIRDPKKLPEEKEDAFKERLKKYADNSYEEFRVGLADFEGSFDPKWAAKLPLDGRRLIYSRPDSAEEGMDMHCAMMHTGPVDLIIADSIAAMTPSKEIEASMEDWQQGLAARLVNKWVRKNQGAANQVAREFGRPVSQIWINQWREKLGITYGSNKVAPGGKGQAFASSIDLDMWKSEYKRVNDDDETSPAKSVMINFKCLKNKVGPPMITGSYKMGLLNEDAGKIDDRSLMQELLTKYGLFGKVGTKVMVEDKPFDAQYKAMEYVSANWERYRKLVLMKMMAGG